MRILFALIGFIFDVIIVAAAGWTIYCAVQPDMFFYSVEFAGKYFENAPDRIRVAGGAAAFLVLGFRLFFLLAFGRPEKSFVLKRDEKGTLTVSISTLEGLVTRLSEKMNPPSAVRKLAITQDSSGSLCVNVKIGLDISNINLNEYTAQLDSRIREYFETSLGVKVRLLDVRAVLETRGHDAD